MRARSRYNPPGDGRQKFALPLTAGGAMTSSPGAHLAYFGRDEDLAAAIGPHLHPGPEAAEGVVLVSTASHRDALLGWLAGHGCDVASEQARGLLLWRDARETLDAILLEGWPDAERFERTLAPLIEA